jgi:cyclic pyranopterin phosphate synthase
MALLERDARELCDTGLRDRLGRRIDNLRVSVTDRCNFRCVYCMPEEGMEWLPREEILSFEEIARVVRIAVGLGVRTVRLTGGEPLVRRDLHVLVGLLSRVEGLRDLALSTNGVLLAEQAEALACAGLQRVNVSLDALTRERFEQIARRDALAAVLRGLEAAARCFAGPVKVNAVLMRGFNDGEIPAFVRFAREHGYEVRFIEFMPLDADGSWSRQLLVEGREIMERIQEGLPPAARLVPDPATDPRAPSCDYVFADGAPGKIGFINSVSEPFCERCNRVRLTADGKLRTCLFSVAETDLAALLRGGADDGDIAAVIRAAVWEKEPGHRINSPDFVRASRSMSQIGG